MISKNPQDKFNLSFNEIYSNFIKNSPDSSFNQVIQILKKIPEKREIQEILVLMQQLQARYSFFKELMDNYSIKDKFNFFHNLRYEFYEKNQVIYQYGDISNKLFILIQGHVNVVIENTSASISVQEQLYNQSQAVTAQEIPFSFKTFNKQPDQLSYPVLQQNFVTGTYFGEYELVLKTQRLSSAFAVQDCHLCTINYNSIFEKLIDSYIKRHNPFLGNSPFAQIIPQFIRVELCFLIKKQTFNNGDIIYSQGQEADKVYFLQEGQILLNKSLDNNNNNLKQSVSNSNYRRIHSSSSNGYRNKQAILTQNKDIDKDKQNNQYYQQQQLNNNQLISSHQQLPNQISQQNQFIQKDQLLSTYLQEGNNQMFSTQKDSIIKPETTLQESPKKNQNKKIVSIQKIMPPENFGEEEIINTNKIREYNAIIISNTATLYILDYEILLKKIYLHYGITKGRNILNLYLRNKIKWHGEYVQAAEQMINKIIFHKFSNRGAYTHYQKLMEKQQLQQRQLNILKNRSQTSNDYQSSKIRLTSPLQQNRFDNNNKNSQSFLLKNEDNDTSLQQLHQSLNCRSIKNKITKELNNDNLLNLQDTSIQYNNTTLNTVPSDISIIDVTVKNSQQQQIFSKYKNLTFLNLQNSNNFMSNKLVSNQQTQQKKNSQATSPNQSKQKQQQTMLQINNNQKDLNKQIYSENSQNQKQQQNVAVCLKKKRRHVNLSCIEQTENLVTEPNDEKINSSRDDPILENCYPSAKIQQTTTNQDLSQTLIKDEKDANLSMYLDSQIQKQDNKEDKKSPYQSKNIINIAHNFIKKNDHSLRRMHNYTTLSSYHKQQNKKQQLSKTIQMQKSLMCKSIYKTDCKDCDLNKFSTFSHNEQQNSFDQNNTSNTLIPTNISFEINHNEGKNLLQIKKELLTRMTGTESPITLDLTTINSDSIANNQKLINLEKWRQYREQQIANIYENYKYVPKLNFKKSRRVIQNIKDTYIKRKNGFVYQEIKDLQEAIDTSLNTQNQLQKQRIENKNLVKSQKPYYIFAKSPELRRKMKNTTSYILPFNMPQKPISPLFQDM